MPYQLLLQSEDWAASNAKSPRYVKSKIKHVHLVYSGGERLNMRCNETLSTPLFDPLTCICVYIYKSVYLYVSICVYMYGVYVLDVD